MTKVNLFIKAVLLVAMIIAVVFLFNKGINYYLDWQQDVKKAQVAAEKAKKQAFAVKLVYVIDRNRYFTMFASEGRCERGGEFWYHDITRGIHSRVGQGKTSYNYFFTDGEQYLGFPTARGDLQSSAPFYFSDDYGQTWQKKWYGGNNQIDTFTQGVVRARHQNIDKEGKIPEVTTPSGWNKMMCLDISMMVADKQGQRVYDDRKIEKLLYKIDNERYFSYLSDGESCNTNGEIFYNDSKNNIRSRLGYFNVPRYGHIPSPVIINGHSYLLFPLFEYMPGNRRTYYTSRDAGKHWKLDNRYDGVTLKRYIVSGKTFFFLNDLDSHSHDGVIEGFRKIDSLDEMRNMDVRYFGKDLTIDKKRNDTKDFYIYVDVLKNKLYRIKNNDNFIKLEAVADLDINEILNAKTPSGWIETQCKPLSALKE
ncbi:T6SS immunity protein Tli3 family protein [Pragia fontium]|uniref:T6SS immunity protein Tli3 family protein n=1 Tax=Pragia fontium TaxID=82985 RepID=UPI000F6FE975|nr:hypothetical protein [Pragia fontium]VEJ54179.1 Uncharacterised protein [Pragia fontium]